MLACSLHGQQKQPIYIIAGDTLTNPYVDLSEVVVLPSIKFKSYDDYVAYYRLQRRTIKVYPYAQLAAERLTVLNQRLANIKRKRAKKRYAKQVERYLTIFGLSPQRIKAVSVGETVPLFEGESDGTMLTNRRVSIEVISPENAAKMGGAL